MSDHNTRLTPNQIMDAFVSRFGYEPDPDTIPDFNWGPHYTHEQWQAELDRVLDKWQHTQDH